MLVLDYPTKKDLKANIGEPLRYMETSLLGPEYSNDGQVTGSNRPHITGHKREFFANVTMRNGVIAKVD